MKRKYDAEWLHELAKIMGWGGVWNPSDDPIPTIPSKNDAADAMSFEMRDDPFAVAARMFCRIASAKAPGFGPKLALQAIMVYLGENGMSVRIRREEVEHWLELLRLENPKTEEAVREYLQTAPFYAPLDMQLLCMVETGMGKPDVPERLNAVLDRAWAYSIARHAKETLFDRINWPVGNGDGPHSEN